MSTSLLSLPHPAIREIFQALLNQLDTVTVVALSVTCKSLRQIYVDNAQDYAKHIYTLGQISATIRRHLLKVAADQFANDELFSIMFKAQKLQLSVGIRTTIDPGSKQLLCLSDDQECLYIEIVCYPVFANGRTETSLSLTDFVELARVLISATQTQIRMSSITGGMLDFPYRFTLCGAPKDWNHQPTNLYRVGPIQSYPNIVQVYHLMKTVIRKEEQGAEEDGENRDRTPTLAPST